MGLNRAVASEQQTSRAWPQPAGHGHHRLAHRAEWPHGHRHCGRQDQQHFFAGKGGPESTFPRVHVVLTRPLSNIVQKRGSASSLYRQHHINAQTHTQVKGPHRNEERVPERKHEKKESSCAPRKKIRPPDRHAVPIQQSRCPVTSRAPGARPRRAPPAPAWPLAARAQRSRAVRTGS